MADIGELPTSVENILKKASEEILKKQEGHCFTISNTEHPNNENETYSLAYNQSELSEFINFDMLVEEDDSFESSNNYSTKKNLEDLVGNGTVLKELLDPGVGQVVPEDYIVLIHYIAYILNNPEPFDVTYLQGRRPKRFTLGNGEMLPGLEIGIKSMTIGENARFIIKPELAYRNMGCPPRIPPKATVVFDVHLVKYFSAETCLIFDEDNRDPKRFNKVLVEVKKLHIEGNEQFKLKMFDKAIFKYNKAKELLHITGCNSDDEEVEMMKYLNKLYTNLSICYLKQCAFNKVCRMGIEAMKYSDRFSKHNAKIFFNWGKALRFLKNFLEAKNKLQKSLQLEPHNVTIQYEMQMLVKDEAFNSSIKSFTIEDDDVSNNGHLPPEFWEVFDTRLAQFVNSDDNVLTVTLIKNPRDIELATRKAKSVNLEVQMIINAGVETNYIAIKKKTE